MSINFWRCASSAAVLATAMLAQQAAAQDAGQTAAQAASQTASEPTPSGEIYVTAQRRSERQLDVPITITSVSSQTLTDAGVRQLSDLSRVVPALRFDKSGVYTQPTIRGVGTAITTSGGGPNVATYLDGFFLPSAASTDFQLMKVQSVQVLKGPQGTLFGRNTTGGAILITTADPSEKPGGEMRVSYGRFNTVEVQGYGTSAIAPGVAFDVEGLYRRGDGFQTNIIDNNDKIGQYNRWSVRTGLKVEASPDVSFLLRYTHSQSDDPSALMHNAFVDEDGTKWIYQYTPTGYYATKPNQVALNPTDGIGATTNTDVIQGTIKANLGFADFTSYTQYRDERVTSVQDLDATALPIFTIRIDSNSKTFTQELLLNSKPGSRLQWTTGAYYFNNRDTWPTYAKLGTAPFVRNGESGTLTQSIAVFADATYEITPQLFLTAGARYSHDWVDDAYFERALTASVYEDANGNPVAFPSDVPLYTRYDVPKLTNNRVTPRAVLRFKPNDESSIYASFTQGYKAGLLNVGGYSYRPVKPETINAYELGYKYAKGWLSADLSGFYYDYKNLQVSSFQAGTARITNAASSEIYGLEGQVSGHVTSDFTVSAGVAWTHARYKKFPNAPFYQFCDPAAAFGTSPVACTPPELGGLGAGALVETTTNASGFKMQRSPEITANLAASYGLDLAGGRLTLSGNLYYTSSFYFGIAQQFKQGDYAQLGLRAEWNDASDKYSLALFGENVTDHRYRSAVNYASLGIGSVWAAPATYGVTFGVKF
ncbi:iron complex outermembrane receptor protein [Novosphingobium sp. PhB165]|uniref:TonB-dependent receptor n=1 Tax=Novosphingobium sp. PhB165 TaxID=2485105 RepID=UPI0010513260|nr:TonB-dependent receptor [Novosphingobium sp. PhB165]TCM20782.1 iron complex outermembrane receptor protein [Novosphingobium sp. PhB165]